MKQIINLLTCTALVLASSFSTSAQDLAGNTHMIQVSASARPMFGELMVNGQPYLTIKLANLATAVDGKQLYTPVTRKEYLQQAKSELTDMNRSVIEGLKMQIPVRAAAIQEAQKKANLDQLKAMYTGIDLDVRVRIYLRNYKTDEQLLKENLDKETAATATTIRLIDSLLSHMTPTELGHPAIVSVPSPDFHGFEDGHADNMLIRMNAAYPNNATQDKMQELLVSSR
jgi:hypothetical protein